MSCRLLRDITHTCEYNAGGITQILFIDIRDFISYQFKDDKLFNECYVESINVSTSVFLELDTVTESNFTESFENGIYKQQLTTFVRTIEYNKTSDLLLAGSNKHLIVFRTSQGHTYTFGSDNGASIGFTQQTGQFGDVSGYGITISKNSIYPLFEIDLANSIRKKVLGTESFIAIATEDSKAIQV